MNQPTDDLNKAQQNLGNNQFDYSGLTPPESMGASSSAPAPTPPAAAPTPAPSAVPSNMPPPPPPSTPPPVNPPKDQLVFPGGTSGSNISLDDRPKGGGGGSWLYIILLTILLVLAIVVFLSWKGWISLGGIEKLWGGTSPTPTPVAVSPSAEPSPGSNDAVRKKDLANLQLALRKYYADNGSYPLSAVVLKTSDSQSILAQKLVPNYISALPDDPLSPQYYYGYKSDGKTFTLTCVLEDKNDTSGVSNGTLNIYTVTDSSGQ